MNKVAIELVDTHCHMHEATFQLQDDSETKARWLRANKPDPDEMLRTAAEVGVTRVICVGTTLEDSELAIAFAAERPGVWASIGLHPHEASTYAARPELLERFAGLAAQPKVVAIGEAGLDYYYEHSPKAAQQTVLRHQLQVAQAHKLPLIFHIRDAFEDFWKIFDDYPGLRGVVHSFTATTHELGQALERGLYVGLNGIMTFTKDERQLEAARQAPLERIVVETDAPFLTPVPFRGTICESRHVRVTAEFLAKLRNEELAEFARATTRNARSLFNI